MHEVPCQERDEESQESYHEEWETGDKWRLPEVWHQDVQDREKLEKQYTRIELYSNRVPFEEPGYLYQEAP